jgi:hypothetical protein
MGFPPSSAKKTVLEGADAVGETRTVVKTAFDNECENGNTSVNTTSSNNIPSGTMHRNCSQ